MRSVALISRIDAFNELANLPASLYRTAHLPYVWFAEYSNSSNWEFNNCNEELLDPFKNTGLIVFTIIQN